MRKKPFVAALASLCLFALSSGIARATSPQGDAKSDKKLEALLAEIQKKGPDAEPEPFHKIANLGTRKAMETLVDLYGKVGSIYLRREVLFALAKFDGIPSAQEPALELIANVATTAKEKELRKASVQALSGCPKLGKHFLGVIVKSKAVDSVRKQALAMHARQLSDEDLPFYERIYTPILDASGRRLKPKKKTKKKRVKKKGGKSQPDEVERPELEAIRVIAFEAASRKLPEAKLMNVLETDPSKKMRLVALKALHASGSKKSESIALKLFSRVDEAGMTRSEAASILATIRGPKLGKEFLKLAKKKAVTPDDLRRTMAKLIVDMNDKALNKKVAKLVGRGKPHEKIFALYATMHLDDPKLLAKIRKGLKDREFTVRRATAVTLAERKDKEAVPALLALLDKPKVPADARTAIEAIGKIQGSKSSWRKRLVELALSTDRDTRNAALEQLAASGRKAYQELLAKALEHEDWTTRLLAIKSLEESRKKSAVQPLINALAREKGRLELAAADALWALTGKGFDKNASLWQTWWENEGKNFEVLTAAELRAAREKREMQRLKSTTVAEFFGMKITSHRVIFILDVSGSMVAEVHGRFAQRENETRIDCAKRELVKSVESLAPNALFNILTFSSGVERWAKEDIGGLTKKTREQAKEWIGRLGAGGGTNLHEAIKEAFKDPDVDTIYILSDGEPSVGVVDPDKIRESVKYWNKHRGIEIHTIAIGGSLQVLEHIAKDAGGEYVTFR